MMDPMHGGTPQGVAFDAALPEDVEGWLTFSPDLKEMADDAALLPVAEATALVVRDLTTRWEQGRSPPAEVYLELCGEWCAGAPAWAMIRAELELARGEGTLTALETQVARFPQWAAELERFYQETPASAEQTTKSSLDETVRVGSGPAADKTVRVAATVAPRVAASIQPGDVLAGYRVDEILPALPGVERFRALDLERRLEVELTLAPPALPGSAQRELLEARLALLTDAGVAGGVAPHFRGWHEERPWVAVELAACAPLADSIVRDEGRGAEGIAWIAQTAKTIAVLHRRGVGLVGPAPETLLIDRQGAALLSPAALLTGGARDAASPWRAPEANAAGERQGPRSDVYVLGALLHLVLTGRPPLPAADRVADGDSPWAGQVSFGGVAVPEPWRAVCQRALAIDPKARYASADDLATELEAHSEQPQMLANLAIPGLVSLAVVLVIAIATWLWNSGWWGN